MGWWSGFARWRKWDTWICGTVLLGKEEMYVRDDLHLSRKGSAVLAEGLSGGGCEWHGYIAIFKLVGQVGLSKKCQNVHEDNICKGIQGNTSKAEIKCVSLNARSIIHKKN